MAILLRIAMFAFCLAFAAWLIYVIMLGIKAFFLRKPLFGDWSGSAKPARRRLPAPASSAAPAP